MQVSGDVGPSLKLPLKMKRLPWLPGVTVGRRANKPSQPVSPLSELWMYSVEAIDTIVLWREGRRGGLRTNNRALSLEMSAVTPGDCPAGQTHFCKKKKKGTKHVENSMKFYGDSANERVTWTRTFTCSVMERQSERGQQAVGNKADHVKACQTEQRLSVRYLSVRSSRPIC